MSPPSGVNLMAFEILRCLEINHKSNNREEALCQFKKGMYGKSFHARVLQNEYNISKEGMTDTYRFLNT